MQYVVLKSFAGKDFTGVKGKIIEIEDKKIKVSLLKNGFIKEIDKKDISKMELEKEIEENKRTISSLISENENLKLEIENLKLQLESFISDDEGKDSEQNPESSESKDNSNNSENNQNIKD